MTRILIEVPLEDAALRRLAALPGVEVETIPHHESWWELPADQLPGPEVLLCRRPPRNLDALTRLKLIQISSVGYDHLRDFGFADRPVRVCNARGIFDSAIAEWNVAMMIALTRDLRGMIRNQEHGVWDRSNRFHQEARGRTVGIWGYGGIGRETARLALTMGMTVRVMTRSGVKPRINTYAEPGTGDPDLRLPKTVYTAGQKREFLDGLGFLILALPHTKESDGLIGEEELRALPRPAFLLNPARGPIVKEAALLEALRKRWIAGAALDTHFAYPLPPDHPLWRFPNVILTPHVSGSDRSSLFPGRMGELFAQNVERYLEGRPLLNELTQQEWLEV
jgi:phosphoglycerate dehydrogenase-like enzyme